MKGRADFRHVFLSKLRGTHLRPYYTTVVVREMADQTLFYYLFGTSQTPSEGCFAESPVR